jgi:hypothetical protein
MFESEGYNLKQIQKRKINDGTSHLYSFIYKFYSPRTKLFYILHADYHSHNIFAIKFYAKRDRKSDNKYSKIINKGDVQNILITCVKVIPVLLQSYPEASFCFIASPSIDKKTKRIEGFELNQRFRIYQGLVSRIIGNENFIHYEYSPISGYLFINSKVQKYEEYEKQLHDMFCKTYPNLTDMLL